MSNVFNFHHNEDEKQSVVHPRRFETAPSPADVRARAVLAYARACICKEKDEAQRINMVRDHIEGMNLHPSQINSIRARAGWNTNDAPARSLVATAAKTLLLTVPLRTCDDWDELFAILRSNGDIAPEQRRAMEQKMRLYLHAVVHRTALKKDLCFESFSHLTSVEPFDGELRTGCTYFFHDKKKLTTGAEWVRVHVQSIARKSIKVRIGELGQEFECRIPMPWQDMRPAYRILALFAQPPKPRHVLVDIGDGGLWGSEGKIISAVPTDRVTGKNWYLIAAGEGAGESLRIVTLEAANDTTLFVTLTAYEFAEIPRKGWRLYRITEWMDAAHATEEVKAEAVSLAARFVKIDKIDQTEAPKTARKPRVAGAAPSAGARLGHTTVAGAAAH
jgi:hypothetical protein